MKNINFKIRDLIRLRLNELSAEDAQTLRKVCDSDPLARKYLNKIRRGLDYLEKTAPFEFSDSLSDEELGAWLEGSSAVEVERVEELARTSDTILLNVVEMYRTHRIDQSVITIPYALHNRLLDLDNALEAEFVATQAKSKISRSDAFTPAAPRTSTNSSESNESRFRQPKELQIQRWMPSLVAIAACILALLAGWVWINLEKVQPRPVVENTTPNPENVAGVEREKTVEPEMELPQNQNQNQNGGVPRENSEDSRFANSSDEKRLDNAAVNKDTAKRESVVDEPLFDPDSRNSSIVNDRFTPAINWQTIKGVVAVKNEITREYSGIKARRKSNVNDEIIVLPQSWGEAQLDDQSTLTLDQDTSLSINRLQSNRKKLELKIAHGRFALRDIMPATEIRFVAGEAIWDVKVQSERSSLGVDYSGLVPVIFQRSGMSEINGQTVKGREQSPWRGKEARFDNLDLPLQWISGPRGHVFNDRENKLAAAADLRHALAEMASQKDVNPDAAAFLIESTLAVNPEISYKLLQSDVPGQGEFVFDWMLNQLDSARGPAIIRLLAEKIGDRQQVVNVLRFYRQLGNPQSINAATVDEACRNLTSNELFFRFAAKQFLVRLSNNTNPVNFNVHDSPQVREEKARRWNTLLRSQMQQRR